MKDLVQIISDNPGCVAIIDNDSWCLRKDPPLPPDFDKWSWDEQNKWNNQQELAHSDEELKPLGGFGGGCYGGDILQALANIVGIRVESV